MYEGKVIRGSAVAQPLSVIVLVDHGWVNGGQAKVAIESALQLKQRGVDVCVVAGRGPADQRLLDAGIECHVVGDHDILSDPNRLRAAASGIWNTEAARILKRCLAARDPETTIVHVHGWAKVLSPSIGRVITTSAAAHVYTLHEYFLACPNGGFFDYKTGQICNRRALGVSCLVTPCDARANTHKAWRVARQVVSKTAGGMPRGLKEIIYLAPAQRDIMKPYIASDTRWHHLPNAVGPAPAERIEAESNALFLFVGRLSREKGAQVAAAAAKLAGVKVAFCGDGECRDEVVDANPDAIMAGWVSQDEIGKWMQRARCLVFPSLWYEGYPLVVADALRAGLPIITSDSTVAASSVRNGVDGLHARAGDVHAWAEAMASLRSDEVVRRYSQSAFAAGQQLLDEEAYIDRLLSIYRSAIERRHCKAPAVADLAS